jgi:hypothetical protein
VNFPDVRHAQCGTELPQQFEYMKDFCYSPVRLLQNEVFYRFIVMTVNKENELLIHAGHYTSFTDYSRQLHGNTQMPLRDYIICHCGKPAGGEAIPGHNAGNGLLPLTPT